MRGGGCIHRKADYPLVLRTMEAKLEREGFLYATPERRHLAQLMAGPKPMIGQNEMEESTCTH